MEEPTSVFRLVCSTLRDQQGVTKAITASTRICADLGVCDEDLSELVEELFARVGLEMPEVTTVLPASEDDLTVDDLVSYVEEKGKRTA